MTSKGNGNIAVVGAGIVGSTVARQLQDKYRNAHITIIAENFSDKTLSAVAAGIFRPGTSFRGPTPEITKKWVDDSWYYWKDIYQTSNKAAGIMELSTFLFSQNNPHVLQNHLIEDLVPIYRKATSEELKTGVRWNYGAYFTTLKIESTKHLPWVEQQFRQKGGKVVPQKLDSFKSLKGYDLVFNCSGLGAKSLCNDHDLVPVRGQIIRIHAPWVKNGYYGDYDAYILPGLNGIVTLGGTRQYDSYNMKYCRHDAAGIMERCLELVPSLKKAKVVGHYVGLRPHRSPVRVEPEFLGGAKVVHCYGHGGYGVTCAPGTAKHAILIGENLFKANTKNKL